MYLSINMCVFIYISISTCIYVCIYLSIYLTSSTTYLSPPKSTGPSIKDDAFIPAELLPMILSAVVEIVPPKRKGGWTTSASPINMSELIKRMISLPYFYICIILTEWGFFVSLYTNSFTTSVSPSFGSQSA